MAKKPYLSPRAMVSFFKFQENSCSLVRIKLYPSEKISDSFKCKGNKPLLALAEYTEFNINFIVVINVLSISCDFRNTLNNMLVK